MFIHLDFGILVGLGVFLEGKGGWGGLFVLWGLFVWFGVFLSCPSATFKTNVPVKAFVFLQQLFWVLDWQF